MQNTIIFNTQIIVLNVMFIIPKAPSLLWCSVCPSRRQQGMPVAPIMLSTKSTILGKIKPIMFSTKSTILGQIKPIIWSTIILTIHAHQTGFDLPAEFSTFRNRGPSFEIQIPSFEIQSPSFLIQYSSF